MFREEEKLLMSIWIPEVYNKKMENIDGYDAIWEWMLGDWINKENLVKWLMEFKDSDDYKRESERIGANWWIRFLERSEEEEEDSINWRKGRRIEIEKVEK